MDNMHTGAAAEARSPARKSRAVAGGHALPSSGPRAYAKGAGEVQRRVDGKRNDD